MLANDREDSNLSLMSFGFAIIILNQGWKEEPYITVIVFGIIYSSSEICLVSCVALLFELNEVV